METEEGGEKKDETKSEDKQDGQKEEEKEKVMYQMSHAMRKPDFCLFENKGADQLRSNCEADQRLCFRYTDSTIPVLYKSKISSL